MDKCCGDDGFEFKKKLCLHLKEWIVLVQIDIKVVISCTWDDVTVFCL